jgi:hypothetical protein
VLLDVRQTLTPADHQQHRQFPFDVPPDSAAVRIHVRYAPKRLGQAESIELAEQALARQAARLADKVGPALAAQWAADQRQRTESVYVSNLLTISLDDADGLYRGAGHRQSPDQRFVLRADEATPGLVAGPLPAGTWRLTLSAHTLVSPQVEVEIQIGADTATTRP